MPYPFSLLPAAVPRNPICIEEDAHHDEDKREPDPARRRKPFDLSERDAIVGMSKRIGLQVPREMPHRELKSAEQTGREHHERKQDFSTEISSRRRTVVAANANRFHVSVFRG
jgi:hypothetical protein